MIEFAVDLWGNRKLGAIMQQNTHKMLSFLNFHYKCVNSINNSTEACPPQNLDCSKMQIYILMTSNSGKKYRGNISTINNVPNVDGYIGNHGCWKNDNKQYQ